MSQSLKEQFPKGTKVLIKRDIGQTEEYRVTKVGRKYVYIQSSEFSDSLYFRFDPTDPDTCFVEKTP
jgi:hypothetical protein